MTKDHPSKYILYNNSEYQVILFKRKLFVVGTMDVTLGNKLNGWVQVIEDYNSGTKNIDVCYIKKSLDNHWADNNTFIFDVLYEYKVCGHLDSVISLSIYSSSIYKSIWPNESTFPKIDSFNIEIDKTNYKVSVEPTELPVTFPNWDQYNQKFAHFSLELNKIDSDLILKVHSIFKQIISFVTANTRDDIDYMHFDLSGGGRVEVSLPEQSNNGVDLECIDLYRINNLSVFFSKFSNFIKTPRRIFYQNSSLVTERDIPIMVGQFEYLFDQFVRTKKMKNTKETKKQECKIDELQKVINQFTLDYGVDIEKLKFVTNSFSGYWSLKEKIEFITDDFFQSIKKKQRPLLKNSYTIDMFSDRVKDIRNVLCHGLKKEVDYRFVSNDLIMLQTLMYFIIFKYFFSYDGNQLKSIFNSFYFKNTFFRLWITEEE